MKLTVEKVTPKKAKIILEGNTQNRKIRSHVLANYTRDMINGRWQNAGDPIRINCEDNLLLDGQHRLRAIVDSGTTQEMVIARGVPQITMLNIDTGSKRTFSDNLRILGYKNCHTLAATIRWMVLSDDHERNPYKFQCSNSELMDWFGKHPFIEDSVNRVQGGVRHDDVRGIKLPLIILHYLAKKEDFELFLQQVTKGEGLYEGDPALMLRRFIANNAISEARKPPQVMHAVTIKAWNAFITGENISVLRHRIGGARPDAFPTIVTEA